MNIELFYEFEMEKFLKDFKSLIEKTENVEIFKKLFRENEHDLKIDIVRIILDKEKFETIANEIFIQDVFPLLKNNSYKNKKFNYPIKRILEEFPESRVVLKHIEIELSDEEEFNLGLIFAETEEIDRFKIVLFVRAFFDLVNCSTNKFKSLQGKDCEQFKIYFIGTIVHELTHLIDYFRYTREDLIKDFNKTYQQSDTEKRAFANEFLVHFVSEDGVNLIKGTNDFTVFKEFVKKNMNCWRFLDGLDFSFNSDFIEELLMQIFQYFKFGRNEFGKLKAERVFEISPFYHSVKKEDILDFKPSEETLEKIRNLR